MEYYICIVQQVLENTIEKQFRFTRQKYNDVVQIGI